MIDTNIDIPEYGYKRIAKKNEIFNFKHTDKNRC